MSISNLNEIHNDNLSLNIPPDVVEKDIQHKKQSVIELSSPITPKIWIDRSINELTPFELSLKPRKLLPINTSDGKKSIVIIDRNKNFFTDEIMCPICLGVLENTWLVMACLHRFCSQCLQKSLRMDKGSRTNHECPLCRVKLASRRSCKPDPLYDKLVSLVSKSSNEESINTDIISSSSNIINSDRLESNSPSLESNSYTRNIDQSNNLSSLSVLQSKTMTKTDIYNYKQAHLEKVKNFRKLSKENLINSRSNSGSQLSIDEVSINEDGSPRDIKRKFSDESIINKNVFFSLLPYLNTDSNELYLSLESLRLPFIKAPSLLNISDLKSFLKIKFSKLAPVHEGDIDITNFEILINNSIKKV